MRHALTITTILATLSVAAAPAGYADHVVFLYPELCERCGTKICIEACSGQAIAPADGGVVAEAVSVVGQFAQ